MKKLYGISILILLSVLSFHCQKEISYSIPNDPAQGGGGSDPVTGVIQGNIVDETGQPAIGVTIKVGNKMALTNARGYFRIVAAALDKNSSLVMAEKTGYFKGYRVFRATTGVNQVTIKLIKKQLTGSVSSSTGGAVQLSNGAIINLPADAVVRASGGAYTGSIKVFASYIDPSVTDISASVPGSFLARDKDNKRVNLASYGMLAVELESAGGEKLQIATNKTATLTTPIPASLQSSAPATISLWYVDEQTGVWKEEGTAIKNGNNYVGEVKHFSYWNCDISVPSVAFTATFKTAEGSPLVYEQIRVSAATGYYGNAYGYTDSLGQINGFVPANIELVLDVLNYCGEVVFTQHIGPYASAASLGVLTVPNSTPSLVIIKGTLMNCSNAPVKNGYVIVYYDNTSRYERVNASGEFSIFVTKCSGPPPSFEIMGVDEEARQEGPRSNFTVSSQEVNTGNILACGTSTMQYINYTIDGDDYSISSTNGDSTIYTFSSLIQMTPVSFYNMIYGNQNQSNHIEMLFYSPTQSAGSFPLNYVHLGEYNTTKLVEPFNIMMTNFPISAGEYYEGNFSGQFRDSANLVPLHNVSCSFRVKKWY